MLSAINNWCLRGLSLIKKSHFTPIFFSEPLTTKNVSVCAGHYSHVEMNQTWTLHAYPCFIKSNNHSVHALTVTHLYEDVYWGHLTIIYAARLQQDLSLFHKAKIYFGKVKGNCPFSWLIIFTLFYDTNIIPVCHHVFSFRMMWL